MDGWQGRDGATHTYLGAYAVDWVFVHAFLTRVDFMVEDDLENVQRWLPRYLELSKLENSSKCVNF